MRNPYFLLKRVSNQLKLTLGILKLRYDDGVYLSVQQSYAILSISSESYQVYAGLRRGGFHLSKPPPESRQPCSTPSKSFSGSLWALYFNSRDSLFNLISLQHFKSLKDFLIPGDILLPRFRACSDWIVCKPSTISKIVENPDYRLTNFDGSSTFSYNQIIEPSKVAIVEGNLITFLSTRPS